MTVRRFSFTLLALFLALLLGLGVVLGTGVGSRWLLQKVFSTLPAATSVQSIEGRLIDRIMLTGLHYQSENETVDIDRLVLTWKAASLLRGTLEIVELSASGTRIDLPGNESEKDSEPFQLPDRIVLPLDFAIANLELNDLILRLGSDEYKLDRAQLSAQSQGGTVNLKGLTLAAGPMSLHAIGHLDLGDDFPARIDIAWQRLQWPLTGTNPQVQSRQGALQLAGTIDDYRISLNGGIIHADLPEATLTFSGQGNREGLKLKALDLASSAGQLSLAGDIGWQPVFSLDLTASGRNFNPAIFNPDIPGSLTFSIHAKGKPLEAEPTLSAELHALSGTLRGYPIKGSGTFDLSGQRLRFDRVELASGRNQVSVDGSAEAGNGNGNLELQLKAPRLDQLWPGLSGNLNGNGTLRGNWHHPEIDFKATGSALRYAEHRVNQLHLDIDYHPEAARVSALKLSANGIQSGAVNIAAIRLEGNGTQDRHRFDLNVKSSYGNANSELTGQLAGNNWRGTLRSLDLNSRDWGPWHLQQDSEIVVRQKDPGVDAELGRLCLVQQRAGLCVLGEYRANGDLSAKLSATELPISLLQSYLPENIRLSGMVNGNVELQQKKSLLTGNYRLELPATILHMTTAGDSGSVIFGASSVAGSLRGDNLEAELNLALPEQDYVRGQVKANIGKTQRLNGRLTASVADLSWIQPFLPQVTEIKGRLEADLLLAGKLDKPELLGRANLSDGLVVAAGHRIDRIDINAQSADRDKSFRILGSAAIGNGTVRLDGDYFFTGDYRIVANATGLSLSELKPYLPEDLALTGSLNADARIQSRQSVLKGDYRIDMPAGTRLEVRSDTSIPPVSLNASTVSGTLDGQSISAHFDLGLVGKDYVRGQFTLNTGELQTLEARIQSSVDELALLNPLVPQISSIKGRLMADLTVNGTLEKPEAQGMAALEKGSVDIPALGLELRKINLKAEISPVERQRLQILGSVHSGSGIINLDGFARLEPGWPVELTLTGNNFEVARLPEAEAAVSPNLHLAFAENHGDVTGMIAIDKARIEIKELPENSVSVSSDEIIVGETDTDNKPSVPKTINANIEVELGKNVHFSGMGLKTDLAGNLRVIQTQDKMAVNGNVDMKNATYKSYGQDLTVRKGRFLFNGPADNPWLDVEATRLSKDEKVTAILKLTGPAKNPKTSLSSEPSLPEGEALAYLITGSSLNRVSQSEGSMVAAAALSYGAGKMSWLVNKLGIDEFEVKEGETLEDTMLAVGQYLNPDFYVGAKVGLFNNQTSLILRRKLTDAISVESQSGESQRIKLNYEIETE